MQNRINFREKIGRLNSQAKGKSASPRPTLLLPSTPTRQPDKSIHEESMRVMVRVRPLLFHELEAEKICHANEITKEVMIYDERSRHNI